MKFQLHIFILFFSFFSCRGPVKIDKIEKNNDSIFSIALKEKITLKSFPENFFKSNGIDDWDSFERFQSSVEGMSKMNPKSLDVFLNGLSINIEKLEKSEFPEIFNKPQILSRLKLLRMQALKAKYFTEYYTKDSIKPALIELYSYYNSLIERMITVSKEDL
ncbi:MAG: hypothetical protein CMC88_05690 [Flavobacteriaceae bacterium]|nr:hypothetical protein [Flavobacteriaceae bacterium]|tara:strand:- start:11808 stop:12293 length:486 start_codon:yes stop_codon:yes gene_type:complete